MEKVPYISTYYFNPKPTITDDVIIPFYMTDYDQSEYMLDKTDLKLDLIYGVDGVYTNIVTLSAGDNTINLGKLAEGEHYFTLQAVDKVTGLKSHKLYNDLLVINPTNYNITTQQMYTVTQADLNTYLISNNNSTNATDMTNTRLGLTKLFTDLQAKGYRKCILMSGIYRIDNGGRDNCISIPTKFTVDMNGSTFKLNTITTSSTSVVGCIVKMYNTYDAHLVNGTLEGDRFERQALGLENGYNGEPINTFYFTGGRYSSIENLTVKATTGHTLMTTAYGVASAGTFTTFTSSIVINGQETQDSSWSTTDYKDISALLASGYVAVGTYAGYRGVKGSALAIYMNFYDANKNFLEMIVGYQYRKTKIPSGAKYLRVSFFGTVDSTSNVSAFNRELGTNWAYKNISFVDTRTTSIATTSCNDLLIDGCTFTRCGNSITPSAVDFEDGWQECQDVYFRNCKILQQAGTTNVIDNAGFNHVYENNDGFKYLVRYSVVGLVVRNGSNIPVMNWVRGKRTGSAYSRTYNNTFGSYLSNSDDTDMSIVSTCAKECNINGNVTTSSQTFAFKNCVCKKFAGSRVNIINSSVYPAPYLANDFIFNTCTFYNMDNIANTIKFSFNSLNAIRRFINCYFKSPTNLAAHNYFNSGIFTNCVFEKDVTMNPNAANTLGDLQFNNCTFKGNVTINITNASCSIVFTSCTFAGNRTYSGYGKANSIFK